MRVAYLVVHIWIVWGNIRNDDRRPFEGYDNIFDYLIVRIDIVASDAVKSKRFTGGSDDFFVEFIELLCELHNNKRFGFLPSYLDIFDNDIFLTEKKEL